MANKNPEEGPVANKNPEEGTFTNKNPEEGHAAFKPSPPQGSTNEEETCGREGDKKPLLL